MEDFSSPGPKSRVCYLCGRLYMLHSFSIHIKQCKELWLAREELKDPKERKKLPEDPYEKLLAGGKDSGGGNLSNSGGGGGGGGGGERPSTSVHKLVSKTWTNLMNSRVILSTMKRWKDALFVIEPF